VSDHRTPPAALATRNWDQRIVLRPERNAEDVPGPVRPGSWLVWAEDFEDDPQQQRHAEEQAGVAE
jgi:hypothetical protein